MSADHSELRFPLGIAVLAAGASARMGRPKLLLPWGDTTVLGHLLAQWRKLGAAQIGVVCAAGDEASASELTRLRFPPDQRIINPAPERGMFSSIQGAARWPGWDEGLTHFAIALGDQPLVRTTTLRGLLEFAATQPDLICQPGYRGRPRHPVILPAAVFRQLAGTTAGTLRQFLLARPEPVALCEFDDPGLDLDLDRPEDYQRAVDVLSKQA
jgi:molybdenum cofactor cytidylyltransferase